MSFNMRNLSSVGQSLGLRGSRYVAMRHPSWIAWRVLANAGAQRARLGASLGLVALELVLDAALY